MELSQNTFDVLNFRRNPCFSNWWFELWFLHNSDLQIKITRTRKQKLSKFVYFQDIFFIATQINRESDIWLFELELFEITSMHSPFKIKRKKIIWILMAKKHLFNSLLKKIWIKGKGKILSQIKGKTLWQKVKVKNGTPSGCADL